MRSYNVGVNIQKYVDVEGCRRDKLRSLTCTLAGFLVLVRPFLTRHSRLDGSVNGSIILFRWVVI
jgi:hypothetical protein